MTVHLPDSTSGYKLEKRIALGLLVYLWYMAPIWQDVIFKKNKKNKVACIKPNNSI